MYALSFDMNTTELKECYPKRISNAYNEIKKILYNNGFEWIQGCTYIIQDGAKSNLFSVMMKLKQIDWFRQSVRDIRDYKLKDWSNFTKLIKEEISITQVSEVKPTHDEESLPLLSESA